MNDWDLEEALDEGGDGDDDDSADETELDLIIERSVERIVVVVFYRAEPAGQRATSGPPAYLVDSLLRRFLELSSSENPAMEKRDFFDDSDLLGPDPRSE